MAEILARDKDALNGLYRKFGLNTPYYVNAFLSEELRIVDFSLFAVRVEVPGREALRERCRGLVPLIARREGVELPAITDLWSYGRLATRTWERQTKVWRDLLTFSFLGEIRQSPAEPLHALVESLRVSYVAGVRPPREIGWALRLLEFANAGLDLTPRLDLTDGTTGEELRNDLVSLFALVTASYNWWSTPRRPREDTYVQPREELLRYASPEQKRQALDVLSKQRFSHLMQYLGATGDSRISTCIEETLKNREFDWHYFHWYRAMLAIVDWPDPSILNVVESAWPSLTVDEDLNEFRRRQLEKLLRLFVDRLAERWPDEPRVLRWRREVYERFPPDEGGAR
jgi:hypothetical protein